MHFYDDLTQETDGNLMKPKLFLQASSAEGDVPGQKAGSDITESDDAGKDEQYEEAFSKMKKAAGKCINFTSAIRFSDKSVLS